MWNLIEKFLVNYMALPMAWLFVGPLVVFLDVVGLDNEADQIRAEFDRNKV